MRRFLVDLTGKRFGFWIVESHKLGALWNCKCDCGTEKVVDASSLKKGMSRSCGCLQQKDRYKKRVERYSLTEQECVSCRTIKLITEFGEYQPKNRMHKSLRKTCNSCRRITESKRYLNDPNLKTIMKKRAKKFYMKNRYGMSEDDYNTMLSLQGNRCAICKKVSHKTLNIDHCHKTNKVRGLLCWPCNVGIGQFKEDINSLLSAINYLKGGVI